VNLEIKYISSEETIDLRHLVLRQGRPRATSFMEGDNLKSTKHIGAFIDSKCVGILSLFQSEHNRIEDSFQYQLRGMAVDPDYRGQNIGRKLVVFSEKELEKMKVEVLWCNAREVAVDFYLKLGFEVNSEKFNIPDVGPHYVMLKKLS
jgi:ribosomal protein S18 acetylase RimI-like enzyme